MAKPMQTWIVYGSSPKSPEPLPSPPCTANGNTFFVACREVLHYRTTKFCTVVNS